MDESKVTSLLATHNDLNMLLRVVVRSLRIIERDGEITIPNNPAASSQDESFRRRILHISTLHRQQRLHIEKVVSETVWAGRFPGRATLDSVMTGFEKDLVWAFPASDHASMTRKRVMLTNYPPSMLTTQEKRQLGEQFQNWPPNEILVHILPRFPGDEFPMLGTLQLRSIKDTLECLGEEMARYHGYEVAVTPHRKREDFNPPILLDIEQHDRMPDNAAVGVLFEGRAYTLGKQNDSLPQRDWNLRAFSLLYDLFQMTVRPVSVPVPGISIAK